MNCQAFEENLAAYVEQMLEEDERQRFESHREQCPACRRRLEQYLELHKKLINRSKSFAQKRVDDQVMNRIVRQQTFMLRSLKMKRYRRLSMGAAAAILLVAMILGWPDAGDSGSAFANDMKDVAQVFQNARTVHIKAWQYFRAADPADQELTTEPWEYWCDVDNGCYRRKAAHASMSYSSSSGYSSTINPAETVCDGEYIMHIDHAQKTVRYSKLNQIHYLLERHRQNYYVNLNQIYGDSKFLDLYQKVGIEIIDDQECEIWQGEKTGPANPFNQHQARFKSWISLSSGDLKKLMTWDKSKNRDWSPDHDYYLFEHDIHLAPSVFSTEPPADYQLLNTKADAPVQSFATSRSRSNTGEMICYFNFRLQDAVVLCLGSLDAYGNEPKPELFEGLKPGGPLPLLPLTIKGLRQIDPAGQEITYSPCHICYTVKDGQYYEWALYQTDNKLLAFNEKMPFEVLTGPQISGQIVSGAMGFGYGKIIEDQQYFDRVIRGIMAELSDSGAAPDYVTYDFITQLIGK